MLLELFISSFLLASFILLFFWFLASPPKPKKVREAPVNDELYTKKRFIPSKVPNNVDVIIIGSGMGGGTAGSLLSKQGLKVLVLEHHDKLGGCTHTFSWSRQNIDGEGHTTCEFDTGCHYTAVDMAFETARSGAIMKYVTDGKGQWNDLGDPYDRVVFPYDPNVDKECPNNDFYNFMCGKNRLVSELSKQINPNEPLVPIRINKFIEFCGNARRSILPMFFVRMCPRWLEFLLKFLTKNYYTYGKLSTGYCLSAILEHGFTEKEVLAQKPLPKSLESSELKNTWKRLKGTYLF